MTEHQMNSDPTYQQPLCTPCAACNESNTTTTRKRDVNETKTTAEDTVKRVPQLRFPEFQNAGEWEFVYGNELFVPISNKNHNSDLPILAISQEYGAVPRTFIDYNIVVNEESISGYKVVEKGDFIISLRSFQGGIEYSDFKGLCSPAYIVLRKRENTIYDIFYKYYFKSYQFIQELNRRLEGIRDGKMVSFQQFSEILIPYPPFKEQQKIATFIQSLDEHIAVSKTELEKLKSHKKALLQKLFPQRGKTTPELRFPEFQNAGEWVTKILGEVTFVVNKRNRSNRSLPIYSISNKDGFLLQSEQFGGLDSIKRGYDISMYKIVGKNTFAYNPARINVGSIGYSNNLKEILISSLYVCFKTTEEIDDKFLMCYFDTQNFRQSVDNNVEGGIRSYLFYENFSRIKIQLPTLQEQKQIASTMMSINDLIDAYENKIALLKEHKKGLLQRLFPSSINK